jgi:hypothetical protein
MALSSASLVTAALKATAVPPLGADHVDRHIDRLLGRCEVVIHAQHVRAFAREGEGRGAAVAHAFAGALAGADDDGDAIFQAHVNSLSGSIFWNDGCVSFIHE